MKKFGHRIRIFYLNCIPENSETVMKLLRDSDYDFEVQKAYTVSEFDRRVRESHAEVIIADHSIQSAHTTEVLETLKQKGLNTPVILITDFESEKFACISVSAGVSDYVFIEKPDRLPLTIFSHAENQRTLIHSRSQMEQSRAEFAELVENLPIGLTIWTMQKQLVYFNAAMGNFSFNANDGVHQQWRRMTIDLYDSENNQVSLDKVILNPLLKEGTMISREDLYILKEEGAKRYVNVVAYPTKNSRGELSGVNVLFFDTTSQKLAFLKTKALSDLLESKNNELSQFGYIISHNLRDPIAKILGLASICDTSTDDARFIVNKITDEANKLDSVVKDLNVIVSVRNVEKEKRESLVFDHEFSLVSQVLRREIQNSKAMIETDFEELNEIVTVKSYLYSVLYNLLSNSIKYRDIRKPLSIRMKTYRIGQYACLSVKDNGLGIDLNKNREKVFGMFRRFHSESIPGKGVGLHFIKSYAEALGGKVEIDSQLDEGTELKVYFLNNNHFYNHNDSK